MKRNLWLLALVAVIVVLILLLKPARKYNWEPTFYHHSEEPFGCKLFDEMAAATMPKGYSYSDDFPEGLLSAEGGKALLIINNDYWYMRNWDHQKIQQLEDYVSRGNKLMIVSNHFYFNDEEGEGTHKNCLSNDLLHLDTHYRSYFSIEKFHDELKNRKRDTVVWISAPIDSFMISQSLIENYFTNYSEGSNILAEVYGNYENNTFTEEDEDYYDEVYESDDDYETYIEEDSYSDDRRNMIALSHRIGHGMFYVHCNPLLFTNYGVLNHDISLYLNHAMADLADCEVVRMPSNKFMDTERGSGGSSLDRQSSSPLSYLLSQKPLRWALYTILAAILLFVFFTARRRQRVIPVVKQPENRNLQFVRLISSIYYHQGDRHDLLRKKYTYFKDELRRVLLMDIEDRTLLNSNIQTLSQLTNIEEQELKSNLVNIPFFIDESNYLEKENLMKYIDFMNDLLRKI